jgi:hypothetical protein
MAAAAFMAATTDIKAGFCGAAAALAAAVAGAVELLLDGSIIADVDVVLEGSFALFEAAETADAVGALVPGAAAVALVAAFPVAVAATSAVFLSAAAVRRVNALKIER